MLLRTEAPATFVIPIIKPLLSGLTTQELGHLDNYTVRCSCAVGQCAAAGIWLEIALDRSDVKRSHFAGVLSRVVNLNQNYLPDLQDGCRCATVETCFNLQFELPSIPSWYEVWAPEVACGRQRSFVA